MIFPWSHGMRLLRADSSRLQTTLRSASQGGIGAVPEEYQGFNNQSGNITKIIWLFWGKPKLDNTSKTSLSRGMRFFQTKISILMVAGVETMPEGCRFCWWFLAVAVCTSSIVCGNSQSTDSFLSEAPLGCCTVLWITHSWILSASIPWQCNFQKDIFSRIFPTGHHFLFYLFWVSPIFLCAAHGNPWWIPDQPRPPPTLSAASRLRAWASPRHRGDGSGCGNPLGLPRSESGKWCWKAGDIIKLTSWKHIWGMAITKRSWNKWGI